MAREWKISITGNVVGVPTTVWLTKDGTETGPRCRTETPAIDELFAPSSGNTSVAAGGSPWTERPLANGGGRPIEIKFLGTVSSSGLYADLKELFDDADANDGTFVVTIDGDPGSKTIAAAPNYAPTPYGFGKFSGGKIKGFALRMITIPT